MLDTQAGVHRECASNLQSSAMPILCGAYAAAHGGQAAPVTEDLHEPDTMQEFRLRMSAMLLYAQVAHLTSLHNMMHGLTEVDIHCFMYVL